MGIEELATQAAAKAFDELVHQGKAVIAEREQDPRYWAAVHRYKARHLPKWRWAARLFHANRAIHFEALADAQGKSC